MGLTLVEVDEALVQAEESFNVAVIGPILMVLFEQDPELTLSLLEKQCRELDLKMHFIAAPMTGLPPEMPPGVVSELVGGKQATHWLWICLHGAEEAQQTRNMFNIATPAENLARLRDTGFLRLPGGTP